MRKYIWIPGVAALLLTMSNSMARSRAEAEAVEHYQATGDAAGAQAILDGAPGGLITGGLVLISTLFLIYVAFYVVRRTVRALRRRHATNEAPAFSEPIESFIEMTPTSPRNTTST